LATTLTCNAHEWAGRMPGAFESLPVGTDPGLLSSRRCQRRA